MHHLDACSFHFLTDHNCIFIPPHEWRSGGILESLCLSVEICVRSITFFLLWHWPIILGSWAHRISIIDFAPSSPLLKKMEHTVMQLSFDWSVFRQNVDLSMTLIPFAWDLPNLVQWLLLESRCSLLTFRSHGQRY